MEKNLTQKHLIEISARTKLVMVLFANPREGILCCEAPAFCKHNLGGELLFPGQLEMAIFGPWGFLCNQHPARTRPSPGFEMPAPPPLPACSTLPKWKKNVFYFLGRKFLGKKKTQMIKNFIKAFKLFLERMQLHILTHKIICFIALGKASSQKKGGLVFSFEKKQMRVWGGKNLNGSCVRISSSSITFFGTYFVNLF